MLEKIVRKDRVHQEQIMDLKQQKEAKEAEIDKNKQLIKDNVRYQDVEEKKKEIDKLDAELIAVQAIINSDEFQKPKEAYLKAAMELEMKNQELKDKRAIQELIDENTKQQGILLAQQQINKDRFNVKRPRYDERFRAINPQNQQYQTHNVTKEEYGKVPMYVTASNGKIVKPSSNVIYDEKQRKWYDKDNNNATVFAYDYINNELTDYQYMMLQLQEQHNKQEALRTKQELAEYERNQYNKLVDDMNRQHIDNKITKIKIKEIENRNKQFRYRPPAIVMRDK